MQITLETAAPYVPASHPTQRYFEGGSDMACGLYVVPKHRDERIRVRVYRDANRDHAELSIRFDYNGELVAHLNARELRDVAKRLLSAAVDIETSPAEAAL